LLRQRWKCRIQLVYPLLSGLSLPPAASELGVWRFRILPPKPVPETPETCGADRNWGSVTTMGTFTQALFHAVSTFCAAVGEWISLEGVTAAGTLVAALATATAAVFAAKSSKAAAAGVVAAQAAVDEARKARRAELTPHIVVEKLFLDFEFVWPHAGIVHGGPAFLARKHMHDLAPTTPLFMIQNFGQSPAVEVSVVFELQDDNDDFSVPDEWKEFGVARSQTPIFNQRGAVEGTLPTLEFKSDDGRGCRLPIYRTVPCELPHLSPGLPKQIALPEPIANRILLRGLQRGSSRRANDNKYIVLQARITCHSMDGEQHHAAFRWAVSPFSYGPKLPLRVYANCWELPQLVEAPERASM